MIDEAIFKYIRQIFNEQINCKQLLSVKEIQDKLTKNEIDKLYEHFSTITELNNIKDKFDRVKNGIRLCLLGFNDVKTCKVCNTPLSIAATIKDRLYCSPGCRNKDSKSWTKKAKETCLKKYGVDSNLKTDEFKQKSIKTCLKKYGVAHIAKVESVKQKIKETNLHKFGHECSLHGINEERTKQIIFQKYGNSNYCASEIGKKNHKKLFADESFKVKFLEKQRETLQRKYGVDKIIDISGVREKITNASRVKMFNRICELNIFKPEFKKEEIDKLTKFEFSCVTCGTKLILEDNFTPSKMRCLKCFPITVETSKMEKELVEFLKQYFPDLIENDRTLIKPYELDILIPSKKLAIEFNGSYWHSEQAGKDKNYHLNKTLMCEQEGYRLIHIFERDWITNQNLIKKKLKAILGIEQERVYARKCTIKEISTQLKNKFLNENHIQGEDLSLVKLGLFNNDELVAVMTFCKPRFNKNYDWELSRYATSKHVIGGAGKLFKYFERKCLPKSIITYADRSYSQGNLYNQLGFKFLYLSEPNYWWINNSTIYSRYQTQKRKLSKLLGKKFNPDLSESENMVINRFHKIFDCGNLVFEKIIGENNETK